MQIVLYLLFICLIIGIVLVVLPLILPIVLIVVIAASIYIWYMKRKIVKRMNAYTGEDTSSFYQQNHQQVHNDDVIDVEFSESEESL